MAKCSGLNQTVAHSYKRFVRIPMVSNFGLLTGYRPARSWHRGPSTALDCFNGPRLSAVFHLAEPQAAQVGTLKQSTTAPAPATNADSTRLSRQTRLHNQMFSLELHPINILIFCRGFCFYIHRLSSYSHRWVYSGWYWPINHLFGKQWAILQGFHSSFQPWEGEPAITIKPTGCWPPRLSWSLFD